MLEKNQKIRPDSNYIFKKLEVIFLNIFSYYSAGTKICFLYSTVVLNLFFEILNPKAGGTPSGELAQAIATEFGSFDEFQKKIAEVATNQFGSGWAWLVVTRDGKLAVTSTANQDNPLMPNAEVRGTPILAIDVWEHAYYLHYQNKRNEYLTSIFNVIDWNVVNAKYETAISKI